MVLISLFLLGFWYHKKIDFELSDVPGTSNAIDDDYLTNTLSKAIDSTGYSLSIENTQITQFKCARPINPQWKACYTITSLPWYELLFK